MFSKACEYALKIMIYLASVDQDHKRAGLKDIAGAIDSPEAFTAKILQQLVRHELLSSVRGPSGGFEIPADKEIHLIDVVIAIDGAGITKNCVLGLDKCSDEHPCPAHDKFLAVRNLLTATLHTTALSDLRGGIIQGNRFLRL